MLPHFFRFLALFPLPLLYPWGWGIYFIGFYVLRWRRDQVERDVAVSLPDLTPAERRRVVRESYRRVGDLVMEMIWGFGASAQALLRRVAFENPDVVKHYAADAKKQYPDFGCSFETFTNADFLEIETLGPMTKIEPGKTLEHAERWTLHRGSFRPVSSESR